MVELVITAAIVLVLAAIAIPNFLRGRNAAKEAAAVASIKRVHEAQSMYATLYPLLGYVDRLWKLGGKGAVPSPEAAQLLDDSLAAAEATPKGGYRFVLEADAKLPRSRYLLQAVPEGSGDFQPRPLCSGIDGEGRETWTCWLSGPLGAVKEPPQRW